MVACVGGILVFCGLWMEGPPEEKEHRDTEESRKHKRAKRGWNILMVGIFVEILVAAGLAAYDGWEFRQMNPSNRPVSIISAVASFEMDTEPIQSNSGGACVLNLLRLTNGRPALSRVLEGESFTVFPQNNNHFLCVIRFKDSTANSWIKPISQSSESAGAFLNEIIGFNMMPFALNEQTEIFGGKIKLVCNGEIKELQIPAAKYSLNNGGLILSEALTNSVKSPAE